MSTTNPTTTTTTPTAAQACTIIMIITYGLFFSLIDDLWSHNVEHTLYYCTYYINYNCILYVMYIGTSVRANTPARRNQSPSSSTVIFFVSLVYYIGLCSYVIVILLLLICRNSAHVPLRCYIIVIWWMCDIIYIAKVW